MHETTDPLVITRLSSIIAADTASAISSEQRRFLRELPDVFSADRVGLYLLNDKCIPRNIFSSFAEKASDQFLSEYERQFRSIDPIFWYLRKHKTAMEGSTLLGKEGWKRHRLHQWLLKWGLGHSMQAAIICNGKLFGTLNVARTLGKSQFSQEEIENLSHVCHEIARHISAAPCPQDADYVGRPQCFVQPSIVTDGMGHIKSTSGFEGDGLSFSRTYSELITRNIRILKTTSSTMVQVPVLCENQRSTQILLMTALIPGEDDSYLTTLLPLPVSDWNNSDPDAFQDLPPRTQMVAELLLKGYSNKLIAKEMSVSENTIKDHIKRIFELYGIHSRSQLALLLASSHGHHM
ncbi:MAG: LuxR C-terminal-related transcriptional regulator [Sterolibacterium sp.]